MRNARSGRRVSCDSLSTNTKHFAYQRGGGVYEDRGIRGGNKYIEGFLSAPKVKSVSFPILLGPTFHVNLLEKGGTRLGGRAQS